ncbi:unnamed protein product [Moneuplotes crassus]|uniref:Uncharacterized protein n=1 Tax=Euplotes crassus TaxID=5936 RepID=A0AAD2D3B7_EUPCR|nr:unnamed protein product [Moneuplotes crassus]
MILVTNFCWLDLYLVLSFRIHLKIDKEEPGLLSSGRYLLLLMFCVEHLIFMASQLPFDFASCSNYFSSEFLKFCLQACNFKCS